MNLMATYNLMNVPYALGALHHIICRGIERRPVFKNNDDRTDLVRRLSLLLPQTSTRCYAWSLLPNHFHLLLKTGKVPVSNVMHRLLTGYATGFNRRHVRHGHLFQNRYKSILCQEETYLLELIRYIHLNPYRAGQVTSLEELANYPWCGHGHLLGKGGAEWQVRVEILKLFGEKLWTARQNYAEFVADGIARGKRPDLIGGGLIRSAGGWQNLKEQTSIGLWQKSDERILGDGDFVESVLAGANEALETKMSSDRTVMTFDSLVERLATTFNLSPSEILSTSKQPTRVRARSLLCYYAVQTLGMTATAVAQQIGLTQSAVTRAVERGSCLAGTTDLREIERNT